MAEKTTSELTTLLTNNITTDLNQQNTATKVSEVLQAIIDSYVNKSDNQNIVYAVKKQLTVAETKTLSSVPITIVAAPGAGYAIEAISASAFLDWGSVAFDHSFIYLKTDTSATHQLTSGGTFLSQTADKFVRFGTNSSGSASGVVENKALQVTANADSTTTGDSIVTVYCLYRIIAL